MLAEAGFGASEAMETHLRTAFLDEPATLAGRRMIDLEIGCLPVRMPANRPPAAGAER